MISFKKWNLFFTIGLFLSVPFCQSIQSLPENMPFHTKLLWGENGLFRQIKLAPETRQEELLLRVKMLQLHQKLAMGSLGLFFYQAYICLLYTSDAADD